MPRPHRRRWISASRDPARQSPPDGLLRASARANLAGRDDALVRVAPLLDRIGRFCDLIDSENDRLAFAALRASETTGRALGSDDFVATLERATGRRLRPKKPGRKPSAPTDQLQLRMPGVNSEA
jgi:hypothetical protein